MLEQLLQHAQLPVPLHAVMCSTCEKAGHGMGLFYRVTFLIPAKSLWRTYLTVCLKGSRHARLGAHSGTATVYHRHRAPCCAPFRPYLYPSMFLEACQGSEARDEHVQRVVPWVHTLLGSYKPCIQRDEHLIIMLLQ